MKQNKMKPVSSTAFYCCGVRMEDAASDQSVCNDIYAKRFMTDEGIECYEKLKGAPWDNAANVVRCRIIDDYLKKELTANPALRVILIGAGFDSRAFRLTGGRWLELDEPQVIEYKNRLLPEDECENDLQRVPVDFSKDSLLEKLAPFSTEEPVITIIEGVFYYLTKETIEKTIGILHKAFPRHRLICDLTTKFFYMRYGKMFSRKLNKIGAVNQFLERKPELVFTNKGYRRNKKVSVIKRCGELGAIKMLGFKVPLFLIKLYVGPFLYGYSIYVFDAVVRKNAEREKQCL